MDSPRAESPAPPSRADRWFAPFEGTRDPYPIAIFRIAFFGGLALHFFPSLLHLDDAYRPGALRTEEWNHWLYAHFWRISPGSLHALATVTMIAVVCGIVGLRPRVAAIVGGLGLYAFASFNGLHLQTLALVDAWAYLLLFACCGGGSAVLSVDALLAKRFASKKSNASDPPPREPKLLGALVLFQTLLAVFFSGVEKLLAGWPGVNEMGVLLSYPRGYMVRDWVASSSWLHGAALTTLFTWLTVVIELGTPWLLLRKRTRKLGLVAYEIFFFAIIAMLEVPPLFYCMFAFGALLALDDDEVASIRARLRGPERSERRQSAPPS